MVAAVLVSITLGFSSTVLSPKNLDLRNELGAYYDRVTIGILIIQDLLAIGIMLLILSVKANLFYFLFMAFSLRARTGYQSTVTLNAYSEFTLNAGTVSVSAGLVPGEWNVVLGLLTAISYAINSLLVRFEDPI